LYVYTNIYLICMLILVRIVWMRSILQVKYNTISIFSIYIKMIIIYVYNPLSKFESHTKNKNINQKYINTQTWKYIYI
jgi:hypothetical protein